MFKNRSICAFIVFILIVSHGFGNPPGNYKKVADGVIVYPNSATIGAIRLQIINPKIIRVTASPSKEFSTVKSLITTFEKTQTSGWTVVEKQNSLLLSTSSVNAIISLSTGAVSFTDKSGKQLLSEKMNGRHITPAVFEGERSYNLTQTFETTQDDSYYGLGQHQSDQYNYKGQQVFLFQNNTEVAIPFLLSVCFK